VSLPNAMLGIVMTSLHEFPSSQSAVICLKFQILAKLPSGLGSWFKVQRSNTWTTTHSE